jgi:putative chitinase
MNLTLEQLQQVLPKNKHVCHWYDALVEVLPRYDITSNLRLSSFLAQCAHESAQFTVLEENLNYRANSLLRVFPRYFSDLARAQSFAHKPELIANLVYANRMGNGSPETGDGYRYRGRGLIQLTGYDNYSRFASSLNISVDEVVDYVVTFEGAVESACWFWDSNNLNILADRGDMVALTRRINGGTNGLEDRLSYYKRILKILEV